MILAKLMKAVISICRVIAWHSTLISVTNISRAVWCTLHAPPVVEHPPLASDAWK
nr:hypothetical protein NEAPIHCB_00133 [Escherichia coli]